MPITTVPELVDPSGGRLGEFMLTSCLKLHEEARERSADAGPRGVW